MSDALLVDIVVVICGQTISWVLKTLRLKLYYGDEAEFNIISELDEKTIIQLVIPVEGSA